MSRNYSGINLDQEARDKIGALSAQILTKLLETDASEGKTVIKDALSASEMFKYESDEVLDFIAERFSKAIGLCLKCCDDSDQLCFLSDFDYYRTMLAVLMKNCMSAEQKDMLCTLIRTVEKAIGRNVTSMQKLMLLDEDQLINECARLLADVSKINESQRSERLETLLKYAVGTETASPYPDNMTNADIIEIVTAIVLYTSVLDGTVCIDGVDPESFTIEAACAAAISTNLESDSLEALNNSITEKDTASKHSNRGVIIFIIAAVVTQFLSIASAAAAFFTALMSHNDSYNTSGDISSIAKNQLDGEKTENHVDFIFDTDDETIGKLSEAAQGLKDNIVHDEPTINNTYEDESEYDHLEDENYDPNI